MITEYPTHLTLDHTISNRLPSPRLKGDIYHIIKVMHLELFQILENKFRIFEPNVQT